MRIRKTGKIFSTLPKSSLLERSVNLLLCLGTAGLLFVLVKGDSAFALGSFRASPHHLRAPLILVLASAMAKTWLRGERAGIPTLVRLRSPLLLFLSIVLIYSLNGRTAWPGDTVPARYLPLSILREFNFDLDEFPFLYETELPYYLQRSEGHIVSTYPPWGALLALPVYLVPALRGISPHSHLLPELEKLAATLITALSAIVFFFALRRITRENIAWLISLVYALGTSSYSTSSQALWQHGPTQLFLALMIYCLIRGLERPGFSALSGFALGGAILCRPVNVLIVLPVGAYILHKRRHEAAAFILSSFPPFLLFMGYNSYYFGSPFTTGFAGVVMSISSIWSGTSDFFRSPFDYGLLGILASPGRGLLVYSPILLFAFVGMAMVWRAPGNVLLKYLSLAPILLILLIGKWGMWWGGHSYGPRLLADSTPLLCLYLFPPFERSELKPGLRYALAVLAALSIGLHALGAVSDDSWNAYPRDVDQHPERLWSWGDSPPEYYLEKIAADVRDVFPGRLRVQDPQALAVQAVVTRFYREVLDREPDPVGLTFWVRYLRAHCNAAGFGTLADGFFDSTQFWTSRPLLPDDLLRIFYRAFLGREPDPVGRAYWGNMLRMERFRIALLWFLPLPEIRDMLPDPSNRTAATNAVTRAYRELLDRDPDPVGLAYWVDHIVSTHDLVGPTVGFLSSPEFDHKALPLQQYVPALYRAFLWIDPDRKTLAYWEARVRADLLSMIHRGFLESEEFQRVIPKVCGR